jgi:uncharacterized protein YhaN
MLDWLDRRREAVENIRARTALKRQLSEVEAQSREAREGLETALQAHNGTTVGSLAELAEIGRHIVERANEDRATRRDLEKERKRLESERAETEERRSELNLALAAWSRQWATAISGLPVLAEAKADAVQEVVRLLDAVAADSEQINALIHRIETIKRDDLEFSAEVEEMAARSGIATQKANSLIIIKRLYDAAAAAQQNEDSALTVQSDIDRTRERLREAQLEAERQRKELSALCAVAGVDAPDSLVAAIEESGRRRNLLNQAEEQRLALVPACGGRSLDDLIEAVNALDMDAVPAQLAELGNKSTNDTDKSARVGPWNWSRSFKCMNPPPASARRRPKSRTRGRGLLVWRRSTSSRKSPLGL